MLKITRCFTPSLPDTNPQSAGRKTLPCVGTGRGARRHVMKVRHMWTHQGMSLYVLTAGEQLAADVAAEGAHARVDDQVPLERAPVLGDVVTVGALELIDG